MSYWAEKYLEIARREIQLYVDVFQTRIAPAFASIQAEADAIGAAEFDTLNQSIDPEQFDEADISEWAGAAGQAHDETMSAMRQGIVNLFVAGLFHVLEQQFDFLVKHGLPPIKFKSDREKIAFEKLDAKSRFVEILKRLRM